MMATLLVWRARIRHFFEKHYLVIRGILKAIVVLIVLLLMTSRFSDGFFSDKRWIFALIAIAAGFVPDGVAILGIVFVVGIEVWQVSMVQAVTLKLGVSPWRAILKLSMKQSRRPLITLPLTDSCSGQGLAVVLEQAASCL